MPTRRPLAWAAWLAASLLLLACERERATPAPSPLQVVEAAPEELTASPPTTAPEPPQRAPATPKGEAPLATAAAPGEAEPPDGESPAVEMRPLEDLLRLPPSASRGEPPAKPLELPKSEQEPGADEAVEKAKERRIQVEVGSKSDASLIDPNKARTRTDAGVAVDVGNETKIRTGVRVEQETGLEREQPHPTVGIERRF